jgi:glycosyl-4,4'-diaponeurosporenoate acyltransferase
VLLTLAALVALAWPAAVVVGAVVWVVVSAAAGAWAARRPAAAFPGTGPVLRLRRFEAGGGWYERVLRVKAWKDRLPEAGRLFGGASKRSLPPGPERLGAFAAESARAETVHWLILASTPLQALWCPPWLLAAMVGFGVVANVPCIAVARYNRARIAAIRARRS